jgi:hypothetical protein
MRLWGVLSIVVGVLVSGCAIKPGPSASCAFVRHPLTIPGVTSEDAGRDGGPGVSDFTTAVGASLEAGAARAGNERERPALLSLSGGSLNGAYGAGYLDEWKRMSGPAGLPRFVNVTGISTGSILATYAFTGRTEAAVEGYSVTRENQLLRPYVRMKKGDLPLSAYVTLVRKGSLGDLAPLRDRLHQSLDDGIMTAVDVDTGEAEALDMTDMATRWARAPSAQEKQRWKSCYVEAILASSSAPMAAKPVFIDNREYIDGGARFGMFNYGYVQAVRSYRARARAARAPEPLQHLIINGDQRIGVDCRPADRTLCSDDNPTGGVDNPHRDWSLLKLALRSEKILANQVYRFSEAMVAGEAGDGYRSTLIRSDVDAHRYTLSHPELGSGTRTCKEWRAIDRDTLDPIQFAPRYMWCLIDYGRAKARAENWSRP